MERVNLLVREIALVRYAVLWLIAVGLIEERGSVRSVGGCLFFVGVVVAEAYGVWRG